MTGIEAINQIKSGNKNLRGADLIGANLNGADLRGANLRGANLIGANLRGATIYVGNRKVTL
jgi:uncharacterized protein YjbI with pentapeptide repeats